MIAAAAVRIWIFEMLQTLKLEPLHEILDYPITAVLYENGKEIENLLANIADRLRLEGFTLCGYIQRDRSKPGRSDCDMVLEDIASGLQLNISENRGTEARGCKLDISALLEAGELLMQALEVRPDMLILNKFGKTEDEGGGLRPLIVRAIELEIPVLIAVPVRNIDSWRKFVGDLNREVAPEHLCG